jgi:hypothetical protein
MKLSDIWIALEPMTLSKRFAQSIGALDHPEGAIRYAFAQCYEQPESFYVLGGVSGFEFSTTDEWAIGASLPRGVEGAAVGAWDGKIFMAGGDDDFFPGSGVSDQVDIYDIAGDTWIGGDADGEFFFEATNLAERMDLSDWPSGAWTDLSDPLPKELTANQAGFCTEALFDPQSAEVWSVGGIDTAAFTIEGSAFFWETGGESCYSIYTDVPWLSISPGSGEVEIPAGSVELEVLVDTTGLSPGSYTASIIVVTNDPGNPQLVVRVTLIVGGVGNIYLPIVIR